MKPNDTPFVRSDGRPFDQIRELSIESGCSRNAEGSASIRTGNTWVRCTATVEDRQPAFLRGTARGWVTAEYSMLPRSVDRRLARDKGQKRANEIQRLIGRSLRIAVDLDKLNEHTITIDCDVIEADGGTRTAALTGAFVALCEACRWLVRNGRIFHMPIQTQVAGIAVGIVKGQVLCDLSYEEDSRAETDLNVFMTDTGRFIGIHGAAETASFTHEELAAMLDSASSGLKPLFAAQRDALGLPVDGLFNPEALL